MIGIYRIYNTKNNRSYIGSSIDVNSRIYSHFNQLIRGVHTNSLFQSDHVFYGNTFFDAELLEECKECDLVEREQFYIDEYKNTYNKRSSEIGSKSRCQVKRELIKVELSQDLINKIEIEAKKQNRTPSNYVETVIKNRFKNLKDI